MSSVSDSSWRFCCQPIDDQAELLGPAFLVTTPPNTIVHDLKRDIHDQLPRGAAALCRRVQLNLWKPSRDLSALSEKAQRKLEIHGLKFPDSHSDDQATEDLTLLNPEQELSTYWTSPPKAKCIHIIVHAPRVEAKYPSRKRARVDTGTLIGDAEEVQAMVDQFLSKYEEMLQEYLIGPPWNEFWKAPSNADPQTALFIDSLKIPQVLGHPMLLLHDIGNGIVDQHVLDKLFNGLSKFLFNVSGSGKTRLLLEGLSKQWGFYFTAAVNPITNALGSSDITDIIIRHIPRFDGFNADPEDLDESSRDNAYQRNHNIAQRHMSMVIMARVLIFERFLEIAQKTQPTRPIHEFQKHWLFLQLRSPDILRVDVFAGLSKLLMAATDEFLGIGSREVGSKLRDLQSKFGLGNQIISVLDEAQVASTRLTKAFRSEENKTEKRPVLRPIVSTWYMSTELPMIVSGTSLSIDIVNEVLDSGVNRRQGFTLVTETGSFDDPERQRNYIKRYIPSHILDSMPDFLTQVWTWVHGRHRFTATLLNQFLATSFQSPYNILNAYIKKSCGFCPSDIRSFVDTRAGDNTSLPIGIRPLDFSQIRNDPSLLDLFKKLLWNWLMYRREIPLKDRELAMVELGFARFHRGRWQEDVAVVDEPIVLLAAAQMFRSIPGFSFEEQARSALREPEGRGEHFEAFIGLYLASAFDDGCKLCDIFHFGGFIPEQAKQSAELVSITRDGEQTQVSRFHLQNGIAATTYLRRKCRNIDETVSWFENPSSLMCFPDNHMGPDIVFFIRLGCGQILPVVLQSKWRSEQRMTEFSQLAAQKTLDPSNFYGHENLKDKKYNEARHRILKSFQTLNAQQEDIQGDDTTSVLKVLVTYPATARDDLLGECASLDMSRCLTVIDKEHLVDAVALSVAITNVK